MYKIAVIGDRESVFGFAALGFAVFGAEDPAEAAKLLDQLASGPYAVIYITEKWAQILEDRINRYRDRKLPAIILIPGVSGNTGRGGRAVHESVEKAVGSDILQNQK
ncbi:MAG: V-type ATP synthase subunit F [Clostridia bacterium]|nr:V-type ATP synthase subunit F [Clostridia bacterium]